MCSGDCVDVRQRRRSTDATSVLVAEGALDGVWRVVQIGEDGFDAERGIPFQQIMLKPDKL